ncbi:MAG: hypothetical protein WBW16_04540 [Bacteroidota bacterium]
MKRSSILLAVGIVLLITWSQHSVALEKGEGIQLAYKLEKGKSYVYESKADIQSAQTVMGNEVSATISSYSKLRLTVDDVDKEGNMTLISSYDSVAVKIHSPQMDSTMTNPFGIAGKRAKDFVSRYGKLIKSTTIDSVAIPMNLGIRRVSGSTAFADFGENAVKVGDSWDRTKMDTVDQMGGKLVVTTKLIYTLLGSADTLGYDCYKISTKGTTSFEGKGISMGMNMFIEGTGTVSGTVYFAPKEGMLVLSETSSQQELTAAVTGQQNMTVPISQTIKITTTFVK